MNPDETARITYYWRDDDQAVGTHQLRATRNLAASSAFATALVPLLVPLSNCALEKVRVGIRYLDENAPPPTVGCSVYRRSIFIFATAQGDRYILSLPGMVQIALLQPPHPYAGVGLDLNHVAVAALVSGLLTGMGGLQPCAPWANDDLVDILSAYWGYERAKW
jgi:hypothetical protein